MLPIYVFVLPGKAMAVYISSGNELAAVRFVQPCLRTIGMSALTELVLTHKNNN